MKSQNPINNALSFGQRVPQSSNTKKKKERKPRERNLTRSCRSIRRWWEPSLATDKSKKLGGRGEGVEFSVAGQEASFGL